MARITLLRTNHSRAVRLPEDVAFPGRMREVTILQDGIRRVIVPANAVWGDFFDAPGVDFDERDQLQVQERESF